MGIGTIYAAYLLISITLTVAVGTALSRSGRVFLASLFGGDERLATAVSRLLLVAFYLLSFGFVALTLRTSGDIRSVRAAVGVLSVKIGEELLVLGALHLANMLFFTRVKGRSRPQPPWRPAGSQPPAGGRPGGGGQPGGGWQPGAAQQPPRAAERQPVH